LKLNPPVAHNIPQKHLFKLLQTCKKTCLKLPG